VNLLAAPPAATRAEVPAAAPDIPEQVPQAASMTDSTTLALPPVAILSLETSLCAPQDTSDGVAVQVLHTDRFRFV
jgi:hypothetical protein